jgi:hypothetical protein
MGIVHMVMSMRAKLEGGRYRGDGDESYVGGDPAAISFGAADLRYLEIVTRGRHFDHDGHTGQRSRRDLDRDADVVAFSLSLAPLIVPWGE